MLMLVISKNLYSQKDQPLNMQGFTRDCNVPILIINQQYQLLRFVSNLGIGKVLFNIPLNNITRPNGMIVRFFKHSQGLINVEFILMVKSFLKKGFLWKELNQTLIALIPKDNCPSSLKDFKLISLSNIIYKPLLRFWSIDYHL